MSTNDASGQESCECPECDFSTETKRGLRAHWGYKHDGIPPWKRTTCHFCGDVFAKKESHQQERDFCSEDCQNKWLSEWGGNRGQNSNFWNGGPVTLSCEWCGGEFERKRTHVSERNFCSQDCWGEYLTEARNGQDNPRWKGGLNLYHALRNQLSKEDWRKTRERIRERDGRQCQMCGSREGALPRKLDVHHIVPLLSGGDNGDYNLVSLCIGCHKTAEGFTSDLPGFGAVLTE